MITERFEIPSRMKTTSIILLVIGLLTLVLGGIFLLGGSPRDNSHFWGTLFLSAIFFLFISVISIFIIAAASLAQGGWIVAYRRVPEAIAANVWIFAIIAFIIMLGGIFMAHDPIYSWVGTTDHHLLEKSFFLNPVTYIVFTLIVFALWSFFGMKFRKMSLSEDAAPRNSTKIYWKTVVVSGICMVVFALTFFSLGPWMWIMSLDPHWFSTLFSWYVWSSAFVSGMALILLFVVFLKNAGYLSIVTKEHIHDLGKFLFAFSIFWTYLWFSQYLLIWYGNIPEETVYYKIRQQGPYSFFFYATIIINFVLPILILMSNTSKRNYFTVIFMALLILFGHWLDFFVMIMPGIMGGEWALGWFEIGITMGFAGLLMWVVSRTLTKSNLIPTNNPFLKETIVHLS